MLEIDVMIPEAHVEGPPHQDQTYDTMQSELRIVAALYILISITYRDAPMIETVDTTGDAMTTITARIDEIDPETADQPHLGWTETDPGIADDHHLG